MQVKFVEYQPKCSKCTNPLYTLHFGINIVYAPEENNEVTQAATMCTFTCSTQKSFVSQVVFCGDRKRMKKAMSEEQKGFKPQINFPFQPHEYPPPPYFPGCFCSGPCKCKYEYVDYLTEAGVFKPFAPHKSVGPPRVCVWEHLSKEDYKKLELANFEMNVVFSLFEKKFPMPLEGKGKNVLLQLLYEALRYSRINAMSSKKSSALVSMYYNTHQFFLSSLWHTPEETYNYFKESILLHTVQVSKWSLASGLF